MKNRVASFALFFGVTLSNHAVANNTDPTPLDYPIKQWLFILVMSLLGGLASWYSKVKRGEVHATNLFALAGEFVVSALAGLLAFLVCDYFKAPLGITGAAAGLAGHAGAKALSVVEVLLVRWAEQRVNSAGLILPVLVLVAGLILPRPNSEFFSSLCSLRI